MTNDEEVRAAIENLKLAHSRLEQALNKLYPIGKGVYVSSGSEKIECLVIRYDFSDPNMITIVVESHRTGNSGRVTLDRLSNDSN